MGKGIATAAVAIIASLLAGCGKEDFTGAYRLKATLYDSLVLNVEGDSAQMFLERGSDKRIEIIGKGFNVKTNDKDRLLLEDRSSGFRWVLVRDDDERIIKCLTCEEKLAYWEFDPRGPYDVSRLLMAQDGKDLAVKTCSERGTSRETCSCAVNRLESNGADPHFVIAMTYAKPPTNQSEAADIAKYSQQFDEAIRYCLPAD
tara:strand:- start:96 stop:701 length:606 start_codon:yes stop_codon:yes gene_type:complete